MSHEHKEPTTNEERRAMLQDLRDELKAARLLLVPLEKKIEHLEKTCPHEMVCRDCKTNDPACPKYPEWGHMSVVCLVCGLSGVGWYCPDSPDHVCYYTSDCDLNYRNINEWRNLPNEEKDRGLNTRYVTLQNGLKHMLPSDHDWKYESDDWCIFCGQPDERK